MRPLAENPPQALHGIRQGSRRSGHGMKVIDGFMPAPGVIERNPLSAADEGVVEPLRVERRVEIDQVYRSSAMSWRITSRQSPK